MHDFNIRNSDIFLVAYPRSGTSWVRRLVASVVYPSTDWGVKNIRNAFPDMYVSKEKLNTFSSPRYIKSHEQHTDKYPSVIYLYRDCRDVFTSYYNFRKTVSGYKGGKHDFLDKFLNGRVQYGRWDNHLSSWLFQNSVSNIHSLSYEELYHDTHESLSELLDFMSIDVTQQVIDNAIKKNTFDKHKKDVEMNSNYAEEGYKGGVSGRPRKGQMLSNRHEQRILNEIKNTIKK
ncbi:sulfotransferase domain-containing protein [Salinibacter ruber]|uniref:sulfotransferase domain-containing protein n=1 Tax=Salinibacter ruber TaxID=146919 RepID=UPI002168DDA2|nr:hypothetical protein [Salinibacter ruber]